MALGCGPLLSDQKRAPARKLITELVRERGDLGRPARVLNCMGLRAAESRARARRPILSLDEPASSGRRQVWTWLPIRDWTTPQVWADIHASGVPYHPIYDLGLSRLSCSLCVLASRSDLVRACQLRPDLAAQYAALETTLGHQFQHNTPMADLIVEANSRPCSPPPTGQQATAAAGAGPALAPDVLADVQRVLAEHTARFGAHRYLDQIRSTLTTPTGPAVAGWAGRTPVTSV